MRQFSLGKSDRPGYQSAMSSPDQTRIAAQIQTALKQLSVPEKVHMLSGDLDFWPGMKALLEDDYYHNYPFPAGACERLGIPGIAFIDGPRGVILKGGATSFPVSMARGASWDVDLEQRIGDAIGKEHRSFGGNLYGGVCINLLRHPAWGRAQETYGEDPVHIGAMGAALVRGIEPHTMACVKHFAANSMENARFKVDVSMSNRTLHEVYLPHFKDCIDAGATAVMSAYNSLNGEWCGQNSVLLNDILRTRWGFKGFVVTDFIFGVRDAEKAIKSGLDLEMPFQMVWSDNLLKLVNKGEVDISYIDTALERMIAPQLALPSAADYPKTLRACAAHTALAREAAAKSVVMLKNDNTALPVAPGNKITVLGALAGKRNLGDRGSSDGRPDYVVTVLDGLQATYGDNLTYHPALDDEDARQATTSADAVILVVGYTYRDEGEHITPPNLTDFAHLLPPGPRMGWLFKWPLLRPLWTQIVKWGMKAQTKRTAAAVSGKAASFARGGDRDDLNLSASDEALIKQACALNKRVIVMVMGGSAIMMQRWRYKPAAILLIWYPGMEGGHAIADIVSGAIAPSGKLPFSIPASSDHLPAFDKNATSAIYDFLHGYKKLAADGHEPAFPYGYGLSYNAYSYANLKLENSTLSPSDTISVTVDITNQGNMHGDEIVQLYISAKGSAVLRAPKDLKGFERVTLAPKQTRTVRFDIPVQKLAYFDEAADDFTVEALDYEISIAPDSTDARALKATLTVER